MATAEGLRIAPVRIVRPENRTTPGKFDNLIRELNVARGEFDTDGTCKAILAILHAIHDDHRIPTPDTWSDTGRAMTAVLEAITDPDLEIPEEQAGHFLHFNALIGNSVAGNLATTTDPWTGNLRHDRQRAFKMSLLTSARNKRQITWSDLADASPELASAWFCQLFKQAFSANVNGDARKNLARLAGDIDDRFQATRDIQEPYFLCTYLGDGLAEWNCKQQINEAVRKIAPTINNGDIKPVIGVFSEYWLPGHSVYRTLKGFLEALKPHYRLIFFNAIREPNELELSLFDEHIKLPFDGATFNTSALNFHGLSAFIFPDVGMTTPSIILANTRIAPVQIMMTGHPASTFGGEVDYFISGQLTEPIDQTDSEILGDDYQGNYSETLVRLPGFGAIHERPSYVPQGRKKTFDGVLINCSWYGQKITAQWLDTINEAVREARSCGAPPVKLRMFSGNASINHGGYAAFLRDVSERITDAEVEVVPHVDYHEYMGLLEEGDFAVDCYPFAGSNTVSDNLHLRKPVVVLEGDRWFNRIGPAMLRACGLDGLIETDRRRFIGLLTDMIRHQHVREAFAEDLRQADLDTTIYHSQGAAEFVDFVRGAIEAKRHSPTGTVAAEAAI